MGSSGSRYFRTKVRFGEVCYGPAMSVIRTSWQAMAPRSRFLALAGLVVPVIVVVALVGVLALSAPPPAPPPLDAGVVPTASPTFPPLPPTPSPAASATLEPSDSPPPAGVDPLLGSDGRLTLLLMGTDYRPAHPGNRTDAMMVVSIDPTTGKSAGFSVPRDVSDFPLPKSGKYGPKVNGLYQYLDGTMGNGGKGMKQAFARAFDIEIDHYVLIGFTGVIKLVRNVGGVDVTLAEPYYDPYYWVNNHHRGWGLPAGKSHLSAEDALIFARSRKGDSDFQRAKRQQQLVMAAVAKVRKRGIDDLGKLLNIAKETVRTDLPLTRAADLFALYSTVDLAKVDRAVFGPKKFAVRNGGTDYKLVFDLCKQWIAHHFPPARPFGAWTASAPSVPPSPSAPPGD
jgi:polyisoprenyl-teichoic acid--peptidoglycan teichoic acid transferase